LVIGIWNWEFVLGNWEEMSAHLIALCPFSVNISVPLWLCGKKHLLRALPRSIKTRLFAVLRELRAFVFSPPVFSAGIGAICGRISSIYSSKSSASAGSPAMPSGVTRKSLGESPSEERWKSSAISRRTRPNTSSSVMLNANSTSRVGMAA